VQERISYGKTSYKSESGLYNYCDVCRKAGPDITSKTKFVTGKKKIKRESEHEKCFSMVSAKGNENVLEISTHCLAITTEFLLTFYIYNLQMRVFWSHCRALRINIKRR
jgi:hypothetical protein